MLYFDIKPLFHLRGIKNPFTVLVDAGLSPQTATKLLNSHTRVMKLDQIELLCKILKCSPNDLMIWRAPKESNLEADHPLHKLQRHTQIQDTLKSLPLDQLNEIAEVINRMKNK